MHFAADSNSKPGLGVDLHVEGVLESQFVGPDHLFHCLAVSNNALVWTTSPQQFLTVVNSPQAFDIILMSASHPSYDVPADPRIGMTRKPL